VKEGNQKHPEKTSSKERHHKWDSLGKMQRWQRVVVLPKERRVGLSGGFITGESRLVLASILGRRKELINLWDGQEVEKGKGGEGQRVGGCRAGDSPFAFSRRRRRTLTRD